MSEQPPDEGGADLAAQFFRAVSDRNISFEGDEIDFADAEDDEMEEYEDDGPTATGGDQRLVDDQDDAILREYDVTVDEGMPSITNEQIYDEVKDRVFESAGSFIEMTKGAEEGYYSDGPEEYESGVYTPPTNVPDSGLTAGEVVELGEQDGREAVAVPCCDCDCCGSARRSCLSPLTLFLLCIALHLLPTKPIPNNAYIIH